MSPLKILNQAALQWATSVFPEFQGSVGVQPCHDRSFGHFQSNLAMLLAKPLKTDPRTLAARLAHHLAQTGLVTAQVAGPGFVNLLLTVQAIKGHLRAWIAEGNLGISCPESPRKVVLDFSGPNVAKAMHVGHIRSTILGDCFARLFRRLGHQVITDNHIGDWGTQFGILLLGLKQRGIEQSETDLSLQLMEEIYRSTHEACEKDPSLKILARRELLLLQQGDPTNRRLWRLMRELSQKDFDNIYRRLDIRFDHTLGESFYNERLGPLVDELLQQGIAEPSMGAVVIRFADDTALAKTPLLVRKSDGAALYGTTDLATLEYRLRKWQPTDIIYVTDSRQQLHFKQVFAAARRIGWGQNTRLHHIWFGSILGSDGKPLKTRSGENIKLCDLLDEAAARAAAILAKKREVKIVDTTDPIAEAIGIGAVKYADLSQNRHLDVIFDWDKMLAFDGNTAPYVLNAYVRIRSILRRGGITDDAPFPSTLQLRESVEQDLAIQLLGYADALESVLEDFRPHLLCQFLFDSAALFHKLYQQHQVLSEPDPLVRESRIALCRGLAAVLKDGLTVLGIPVLEEM